MTMTAAPWLIRLAKLNAVGERVGPQDREHDDQHDQAEDGRQRADVAAADPGDVVADGVAERSRARARGVPVLLSVRRGRCSAVLLSLVGVVGSLGAGSASRRVGGAGRSTASPIDRSGRSVISSTTWLWVTSLASTWATIWPR